METIDPTDNPLFNEITDIDSAEVIVRPDTVDVPDIPFLESETFEAETKGPLPMTDGEVGSQSLDQIVRAVSDNLDAKWYDTIADVQPITEGPDEHYVSSNGYTFPLKVTASN